MYQLQRLPKFSICPFLRPFCPQVTPLLPILIHFCKVTCTSLVTCLRLDLPSWLHCRIRLERVSSAKAAFGTQARCVATLLLLHPTFGNTSTSLLFALCLAHGEVMSLSTDCVYQCHVFFFDSSLLHRYWLHPSIHVISYSLPAPSAGPPPMDSLFWALVRAFPLLTTVLT